jgi:hypothetical protein
MNKFAEAPERSKCEAAFVRPLLYYLSCTHVPYLTEMTKACNMFFLELFNIPCCMENGIQHNLHHKLRTAFPQAFRT